MVECPRNVAVVTPLNSRGSIATWPDPTINPSAIGPVTLVSRTHTQGQFFLLGETPVTYTYRDQAGNLGSCTFIVFVVEGR